MYAGFDKFGGDVVGGAEQPDGDNLRETLESSSMEEMLVVQADIGNGPQDVVLCARLNADEGGLTWVPEEASQSYKLVPLHFCCQCLFCLLWVCLSTLKDNKK